MQALMLFSNLSKISGPISDMALAFIESFSSVLQQHGDWRKDGCLLDGLQASVSSKQYNCIQRPRVSRYPIIP
jgi:hypothetical protein